jgi:hypothetical protein
MIRAFISYCQKSDTKYRRVIEAHLRGIGISTITDVGSFRVGMPVDDEVLKALGYAHVVLAVITEESVNRAWVQQEIGYAYGSGVPVICIVVDEEPAGIVRGRLYVKFTELKRKLTYKVICGVVEDAGRQHRASYQCAFHQEERSGKLVKYADIAMHLSEGMGGKIRYWGAFTSLAIPSSKNDRKAWIARGGLMPSDAAREMLVEERSQLLHHARRAGCDLIIDPYIITPELQPENKAVRLQMLYDTLNSLDEDKVRLVVLHNVTPGNLVIVGNWFLAESMSPVPGVGFRHTVFTQHAPTVTERVAKFDEMFNEFYEPQKGKTLKATTLFDLERQIKVFDRRARQVQYQRSNQGQTRPPR